MNYTFQSFGHPNVKLNHHTTFEFTKDNHLTEKGDCIFGVNSDFEFDKLKPFLKLSRILIKVEVDSYSETIEAKPNPEFKSNHEMVIRRAEFLSDRTFATLANKASIDFSRKLVHEMRNPNTNAKITIFTD